MDIRIWSVIISAFVAILIAGSNHFIIEPSKERKRWKKQQLSNLYAPLYTLLSAKIQLVKDKSLLSNRIMIGSIEPHEILSRYYMHEFIMKNAGYGSHLFLESWSNYMSSIQPDEEITMKFVSTVVQEYNQLKKDLNQDYNEIELKSGIPEVIKELRGKIAR